MTLPRSLVLFLAFCGGGALFATALLLAALALGGGAPSAPVAAELGSPSAAANAAPQTDEVIGELTFRAFDLGFEPASLELAQPGRYAVTFVNDGAILHDLTFGNGEPIVAEAGETVTAEVEVPAGGVEFICSVPGHAAGGMTGRITIEGDSAGADDGAAGPTGETAAIEPDPNAPDYQLRDPAAPPLPEGTVHEVDLYIVEQQMTVAPGFVQTVYAYGLTPETATVPGPTLRVKVGDTLRVTFKNPETNVMPHSLDFHASMVAWNDEMRDINPGEELVYEFQATYAGVFMYHCGTAGALSHIMNGMYGMIIVEPEGGLAPVDREFFLVQSDWYLGPQGELGDFAKATAGAPDPEFVTFNGIAAQYKDNPIQVEVGERIRIFVLDAGPNVDSSFHIVGTIFDEVIKEGVALRRGNEGNWGAQAVDLAPAQGAIVEFSLAEEGLYPFVTHAFNYPDNGAIGLFQAGDGEPAPAGSN